MKLSDVIKELENGSTMTYKATSRLGGEVFMNLEGNYFNFEKQVDGYSIAHLTRGGAFNANCSLEYDWRPVGKVVDWRCAIDAWANGYSVAVEFNGTRSTFLADNLAELNVEMIHDGRWYVDIPEEGVNL